MSKEGPPTWLGLVCYTRWVKRWSEAMDFLQTFFLQKYFKLTQDMSGDPFGLQTFASVVSEKKCPPKNGIATKFIVNFCLCS